MREQRRVRLAERQIMLARIARREAMSALAETIAEEAKSAALAERSRELSQGYSVREDVTHASDLRERAAMASGLASLAHDADKARTEAQHRAASQVDALAGAETRLQRLEERAHEARRTLAKHEAAREQYSEVARKLLNPGQRKSGTKP